MKEKSLVNLAMLAVMCLLMTGCASTLKSEVTAFHEWPGSMQDKSFAIEPAPSQNDLEYRSYAALVSEQLNQLGFRQDGTAPALKVSLRYSTSVRDVKEIYPVRSDPFWYDTPLRYGWPGHPYHSPFYSPLWYGMPTVEYRELNYSLYTHQLKIGISRMQDGKLLYDVTVNSESRKAPLAAAMPYMVRSAFSQFPGPSGVPRQIELKMAR